MVASITSVSHKEIARFHIPKGHIVVTAEIKLGEEGERKKYLSF